MASHDIALVGAPDTLLGTPQSKSKPIQAMQFTMTNDILEELLECVKSGKPPQVLFGNNPSLRYNGKSYPLETQPEKFRYELYSALDGEDEWSFAGVINHSISLPPSEDPAAGMDLALETLKSRMAAERLEREANKTIISTPELQPKAKKALANPRNNLLNRPTSLSRTSSPALSASKTPLRSPPKSVPMDRDMGINARDPAVRRALILFLSSEPRSVKDCRVITGGHSSNQTTNDRVIKEALKTMAMCNDPTNITAKWSLLDKSYKELKPFDKFDWPSEEMRTKAIENAIRAFDRMRIQKDDPLWQTLLRKEERGKGKVLSRLQLQGGSSQSKTPAATPTSYDRKTGLPKKSEAKKAAEKREKKEKEKEKEKEEKEDKAKGAKVVKQLPKDKPARELKNVLKPDTNSTPTVKATRPVNRNGTSSKSPAVTDAGRPRSISNLSSSSRATTRDVKPSAAAKSLLNKPKNPSPLSKSPPVNASELGVDHPVHRKLSAAASPAKKRKADDFEADSHRQSATAKRQNLGTPSSSEKARSAKPSLNSSSAEKGKARDSARSQKPLSNGTTTASLKRKANDIDSDSSKQSTPTKLRRTDAASAPLKPNGFRTTVTKPTSAAVTNVTALSPPRSHSPSTETSSDDGKPLKLTWKQALEMALRYEQYYPHYYNLYMEISGADHPPSAEKREQLQKMHNKLKLMKDQIAEASWRGKDGKGA